MRHVDQTFEETERKNFVASTRTEKKMAGRRLGRTAKLKKTRGIVY